MYLPADEFLKKYPLGDVLSHGGYGIVHESGDYVVKIQKSYSEGQNTSPDVDSILAATLREIDFGCRISHPCIVELLDWSLVFISDTVVTTYLAYPKGKDILDAYQDGEISQDEIASDILSAIAFLHTIYICHRDIKTNNIIYLGGKAVLIDFGLATNTIPMMNYGSVTGVGFTPHFRDPQYLYDGDNKDISDEYAFGITLYCILTGQEDVLDGLHGRAPYPHIIGYNIENLHNPIIEECLASVDKRLPAKEILEKYNLEHIPGLVLETAVPTYGDMCTTDVQNALDKVLPRLINIFADQRLRLKTLFLAIHLVHRSLKIVVPDFVNNHDQFFLHACCCAYLACAVETEVIHVEMLINYTSTTALEFYVFLRETLIVLEGIISTDTYWFQTDTIYDSFGLLIDSLSCNYDLNRIRRFKGIENIEKQLTVTQLMTSVGAPPLLTRYFMNVIMKTVLKDPTYIPNDRRIVPVLPNKQRYDISKLVDLLIKRAGSIKNTQSITTRIYYINETLYFADYFAELTPADALKFYNAFTVASESRVCLYWYYKTYRGFEFKERLPQTWLNSNVNPFAVSSYDELKENNKLNTIPVKTLDLSL